jgi:hypothetical protein
MRILAGAGTASVVLINPGSWMGREALAGGTLCDVASGLVDRGICGCW